MKQRSIPLPKWAIPQYGYLERTETGGDMTWVKVMNIGPRGIDLSRKDALRERGEA